MTGKCTKKGDSCCNILFQLMENKALRLYYNENLRIQLLGCVSNSGCQTLFYCFCCGKKFPESLREIWYSILTEEYNVEDPWEAKYEGVLPEEFMTDEWWKKRGL